MGLRIQERGEVIKGTPVVQPGNELFWFNRPRLLLYLINFVLFQNAFQLAFFVWAWYEFGLRSCFHEKSEDIAIRLALGVFTQILCSYVTLPLYALVTQMGTNMQPGIFNEKVVKALHSWHQNAKKHLKEKGNSNRSSVTPFSSRPGTPMQGMSPVHLLHDYRGEINSGNESPNISNSGHQKEAMWSRQNGDHDPHVEELSIDREGGQENSVSFQTNLRNKGQLEIEVHNGDFSFGKRN